MEGKKIKRIVNFNMQASPDYTGFWQTDDKAKHKISRGMQYRAEHRSIPDVNNKTLAKK